MDKIDRDGEKKHKDFTGAVYANYARSKLIVDNGLEDLLRRENPDCPDVTCYDRFFAMDPG